MADWYVVTTCMHCTTQISAGRMMYWRAASGILPEMCTDSAGRATTQRHEPHTWRTENGGEVVLDNKTGNYVFIESPDYGGYMAGETMPPDWRIS